MCSREPIKKGTWVLRSEPLFNDDQELLANSFGRVSGLDGSLTAVHWLCLRIPLRIPVHRSSLKSLNGQAGRFDVVLVGMAKIHKEFLLIQRGDPPHLHSLAIRNLLSAVYDQLMYLYPEAASKLQLAIDDFEKFCKTQKPHFADWFSEDLSDALSALPWVMITG